ncbi:MAG: glycosyltransferase family 39 protein [Acidobacteria bacterium]|nr:glycosyltransferase family 39 protein [Acidobacteriota bacterium]
MPERPLPKLAMGTLGALAAVKLLLHVVAINQYGYFRDELYYLASTEHLDWGYVDHPPLSIAILALVRALLGDSLVAVRIVPVLAGVATIFLVGLITRRLGGGGFAQGLAGLCTLMSPVFLGQGRYFSMNAFDLLFWTLAAWLVICALDGGGAWHWVALGVVLGLGLLNKISMLWFGAGLFVGLLLTPHRRVLRTVGPWLAGGIAGVLFLPYLLWEMQNGWPTLEFMRNATTRKMTEVSPLSFLLGQVLDMNPGCAPVWIAGILFGFIYRDGRRWRVLVWTYLTVFAILVASGRSRASYLAVAYPMLLALGGVALEHLSTPAGRRWLRPALVVLVSGLGLVAVPMALPVLPVEAFLRYQSALGLSPLTEERHEMGLLPQHYADMFGWEELTALVAKAHGRLTQGERLRCRVFGQNYGEAGAIDVLGRKLGLPRAISGHNSYWMWGPAGDDWEVLIIIGGDREDNAEFFEDIEIVGQTDSPWSMPYERHLEVSIARRPKTTIREAWPRLKMFI